MRINVPFYSSADAIKAIRTAITDARSQDIYFPRHCSIHKNTNEFLFFSGRGRDAISALQFFKTVARIIHKEYPDV